MKYYIIGLVVLILGACDDFLEESSQDMTYAKTVADLEEVLIGSGYVKTETGLDQKDKISYLPWLHLMDDDTRENCVDGEAQARTQYKEFYLWGQYPWMVENEEIKDQMWVDLYKHISVVNVVLSKLDEINDFPEDADRLRGECHFLRAYFYHFLVNLYAKPYTKATAGKDLGVPIKTTEFIEDIYFSRNTVAEVYGQIVSDLKDAVRLLKGKKVYSIYQANYYAAQALFSRVHLYMGDYEACVQAADSVIASKYSLLDYNTLPRVENTSKTDIVPVALVSSISPETIFSQGINAFCTFTTGVIRRNAYKISDDLVDVLHKEQNFGSDLRYLFGVYVAESNQYYDKRYMMKRGDVISQNVVSSEWLLKFPEVLLNKAEALVMLEREREALSVMEKLRKNRVESSEYKPLDTRTGKGLMELIRDERRRELCFEGHRWFDLRRYAVHAEYPFSKEIVHDHYYYNNTLRKVEYLGSCVLKEYAEEPAYVLPIPRHVIEFNKGNMVDNEIRPQRSYVTNKSE